MRSTQGMDSPAADATAKKAGHLRIATVHTNDLDAAVQAIKDTAMDADRVEVRLDALWPTVPDDELATDQLIALVDAARQAGTHLLATLRPTRQGGAFDGPEDVRVSLLAAAAKAGFHGVDLEADLEDAGRLVLGLKQDADEVVLSQHAFPKTPSKDQGLIHLQAMQDAHADVQKVAFPASAFPDLLRALELVHQFRAVHGRPAAMPIGFGGAMGRALLPLAGASATYGHASGTAPAVPGQPSLASIQSVWDHWNLPADDLDRPAGEWIAVIGHPVHHSLSPRIHNAALRTAGRRERYGALDVPDSMGAVRLLFGIAQRIGLRGVGVTAPLKVHALDACTPDATAQEVGAVNTVRFRGGRIEGTNTDSTGLRSLIQDIPGTVVVLGAGGVARAAVHAAKVAGHPVMVCNRDPARAENVADRFHVQAVPWEERDTLHGAVWVQCTSLGSDPEDPSPVDIMSGAKLAIEMVYAAGTTAFERLAKGHGARTISGIEVLVNQAADQYRFWTDEDPPEGAMQGALQ